MKEGCLFVCSNGSWNQGHNDTRKTIKLENSYFYKNKIDE